MPEKLTKYRRIHHIHTYTCDVCGVGEMQGAPGPHTSSQGFVNRCNSCDHTEELTEHYPYTKWVLEEIT